jgi:hypothetical protein
VVTSSIQAVMIDTTNAAAVSSYLLAEQSIEFSHDVAEPDEMATWAIRCLTNGTCHARLIGTTANATGRLRDLSYRRSARDEHLPIAIRTRGELLCVTVVHEMEVMVHFSMLARLLGLSSLDDSGQFTIASSPPLPFQVNHHPEIRKGCQLRIVADMRLDLIRSLGVYSQGQLLSRLTLDELAESTVLDPVESIPDEPNEQPIIRSGRRIISTQLES